MEVFYKNSLPVRDDLSFEKLIVVELKFGWKKIYFTNFENLNSNIKTKIFLQYLL